MKHTQDLTLSWFNFVYSQTGIENLLLKQEEKPQWLDHVKTTDKTRILRMVLEF
jgi:hypothetical protein